jgi:hypothetical protein
LVAGAGIAGPALAYWLNRRGHRPVLVERMDRLRHEAQGDDEIEVTRDDLVRILFDDKRRLARTRDYGFGSPGAIGGIAGSGSGCVGNGGGTGWGAGVSPGCGATSPAGGMPSVGSVGADQKPAGSIWSAQKFVVFIGTKYSLQAPGGFGAGASVLSGHFQLHETPPTP